MAQPDSLRQIAHARTPFSTWFGVVLLFALFGLIVFAVIGPSSRTDTYESSRAKKRAENLKTLREDAAKALTSYAWVDKAKGTARIPIDRAMELTLADLKTKKPGPGGPIVTTPPAAGAQAPAAASPAASASPATSGKGKGTSGSGTPKPTSVEGPESANRGQPAAATNPAKAPAGTQPGANAAPAGSATPSTAAPAASPSPMANPPTSGSPLPVRGASAAPSASPH